MVRKRFENQTLISLLAERASSTLNAMIPCKTLVLLLLICISQAGFSQGPQPGKDGETIINGSPRIIHYTRKEFNGDPQFWTMCQDKEGVLYFGNNDGALIFDGEQWQKIALPNNSSIRCLRTSSDGVIYAGGFNEIGCIKKDAFGKYYYESFLNLLRAEDRNLENVWQIHEVQGFIVYRSAKVLIAIADNKALTIPTSGNYTHSTVINKKLYVQDGNELKLLDLHSLEFKSQFLISDLHDEELASLLPGFDTTNIFIFTKQGAAYLMDTKTHALKFWQRLIPSNSKNLITCALKSSSNQYYLGTLSTEIISFTQSDNTITQTSYSLQDNTVLNLFETREGNIWALLNNGIDCIDISSPVSIVLENAAIFDAIPYENNLYVATNQGVFVAFDSKQSPLRFEKIDGLEGQAWSLQQYNGKILCSHDRGLFVLNKKAITKIPVIKGVWKVIPIQGKPNEYLGCTYDGIYHLEYSAAKGYTLTNKIDGFTESSRDILQTDEPGVFWVCHGYKGVFRIKINETYQQVVGVEHFKNQNGLPSPFNVNVFSWHGQPVFTTNGGVYQYNKQKNQFEPHPTLMSIFGATNVRKLFQDHEKTWFSHDDEVGYFITDDPNPKQQRDLFLQLKGTLNRSFECIVPLSEKQVLIGTNTGLYAFDLIKTISSTPIKTQITRFSHREESEEVLSKLIQKDGEQLSSNTNSIQFNFSAPAFQDKQNIQYSYYLEGLDATWSDWAEASTKEYSHLARGHYVFHVKARSLLGEKAIEATYPFEILPVWYQTNLAYIIYILISLISIRTTALLVKRKIHKEKTKTVNEEKEKRKVLELELQHIKLEREKEEIKKDKDLLEEDVIHKSKELANYTMLLVKKRELLAEIHDEIKELKDLVKNDVSRQKMRDLIKKINFNLESEEHLQIFEANFERVHNEFFTQLKTNFPDLTQKELRLCAFVRMNLANKEIASILNISVRGVETARYRLRKRLSLTHDEDMVSFLEKLFGSGESAPEAEEKIAEAPE
jgi:AraC family chitin signaling transcriptional activator